MLIVVGIMLIILMGGLVVAAMKGAQVDLQWARDAWRRLDRRQRRVQAVLLVAWVFGIAVAFGVGFAIGGNWQGGVAGAVVWGLGLAVIGPLLALGARRRT